MEWQHTSVRIGCAGFVRTAYLEPLLKWNPPTLKKIEASKKVMEKALNSLENIWLSDSSKSFLATDEISFADLLAACEIEETKIVDYDPFAGRPKLAKWRELVREKTNPEYDMAHEVVFNLIGTHQKSRLHKLWKVFFSYGY